MLLKSILLSTLVKFASSKTMRYEVLPFEKNEKGEPLIAKSIDVNSKASGEFQDMVSKVINTIYLIAAAVGNHVVVDGDVYNIGDYNVPVFAQQVIDAGHIYFNEEAANITDEIFTVEVLDTNEVLTPAEFNAFWMRYNLAQPDDIRFTLNPCVKSQYHVLNEIELVKMDDGNLGLIGGSKVSGPVCQILGISLNLGSVLKRVPSYSTKELVEWLLQ